MFSRIIGNPFLDRLPSSNSEVRWLSHRDVRSLIGGIDPQIYDRKLRLFACACCRRIWSHLGEAGKKLVVLSEMFADSNASLEEVRAAVRDCRSQRPASPVLASDAVDNAACAFEASYAGAAIRYARASECAASAVAQTSSNNSRMAVEHRETFFQRTILLDILGNPFQPVSFVPEWRTAAAVALAESMYQARDFAAMPILADALQDAGCENEDILSHCRGPEPHVRGCWVVDLVTGRE